ncbi:hypothetical protein [Bartonella sp. WD16.2]|uniref:hypothetical protein n=1 Tax=Bartonella sp. WD16.2 TaxID=1933904 RepID=UPI00099A4992|nr:hypothetical protein [Bartonella sp. WD16.2]AQX20174.1 hypothetical protein BWD162_010740 [Bartonella sp. WD16.2]
MTIKETNGNGTGVHAEGGKVTIMGGAITNVQTGIVMMGKGTLKVEDNTTINFIGDGYGVGVWGSMKNTDLTEVQIKGEGSGKGIGVIMAGSGTMTLTRGWGRRLVLKIWQKI